MAEPTITDAVMNALSDALDKTPGRPMVTGFIAAVSTVDSEGANALWVLAPAGQQTHICMGLGAYVEEWFRDDARRAIYANEDE